MIKKATFSLLSGAYVNAGDFLIVDRTKKLLKEIYPNCNIIEYKRNEKLDKYLKDINNSDALIIAGGPAYMINMYPEVMPLVDDLSKIKTKIVSIGLGWYGKSFDENYINNYVFTDKTKELLNRIQEDSGVLSCRDWITVKVLEKNGFTNAIMTGCPAWYNIKQKNVINLRKEINYDFKKICISDPADELNYKEAFKLAIIMKSQYPKAIIYFVFHRIQSNSLSRQKLIDKLKQNNIKIVDITGDAEGFKVYDDCDLHIGYRVHAHIYNLSNRNISILLEEDGRGIGVNQTLGLTGIKAYNSFKSILEKDNLYYKLKRKIKKIIILNSKYKNNDFEKDILNILQMHKSNNYSQFIVAFNALKYYYSVMNNYLLNILLKEK